MILKEFAIGENVQAGLYAQVDKDKYYQLAIRPRGDQNF
jgi:hypothetical protein